MNQNSDSLGQFHTRDDLQYFSFAYTVKRFSHSAANKQLTVGRSHRLPGVLTRLLLYRFFFVFYYALCTLSYFVFQTSFILFCFTSLLLLVEYGFSNPPPSVLDVVYD